MGLQHGLIGHVVWVGPLSRLDARSFLPRGPHLTSPTAWGRNPGGRRSEQETQALRLVGVGLELA